MSIKPLIIEDLPFIKYVKSNKSNYRLARNSRDPVSDRHYIDPDEDFIVGDSGGFLMKIDFEFVDTYIFNKVADAYDRNIKDPRVRAWVESLTLPVTINRNQFYYCPHPHTSKEYRDFWVRETERRAMGMIAKCKKLSTGEVVDIRITGDHYNYLNYGRIQRTPTDEEKKELYATGKRKQKKISGFPRFWDGDYWNFKVDEFVTENGFHLCKSKARRKGYSYKRGSQGANTINGNKGVTIILAAYDLKYLTDPQATSDMLKTNLDWYEDNTFWRRFYLSEDLTKLELGYKKKSEGNKKYGYRSKALSVSIGKNASAAIGKDAIEIDLEESGKCPNLQDFLNVTLSSTESGADVVGTMRLYGTGGAKDADWEAFADAFYNPSGNDMMPFENVWDKDARSQVCGFFHPQVMNMEPFMDVDGNSLYDNAWAYDRKDKIRAKATRKGVDYAVYVGQRANSPEEAFKNTQENIFASAELDDHIKNIQYNPEYKYYRDGMAVQKTNGDIFFKPNVVIEAEGGTSHPYIEDVPFDKNNDLNGCVREFYPPFRVNGEVPSKLYYKSLDPVAKDKESGLNTNKHSLNSLHVIMYPNNISNTSGDLIVAAYAGRPATMETFNRQALLLAKLYNAKILAEVDTGQVVQDFRKWKELGYLYKSPLSIIDEKISDKQSAYGIVIGSTKRAEDGLIYIKDWLYEPVGVTERGEQKLVLHYIRDLPTLKELQKFNLGGNFDRISSLRVAMFQRSAHRIKGNKPKSTNRASIWQRINLHNNAKTN